MPTTYSRSSPHSLQPHAAQTLADLGAEVTKVEAPWGDDTRTWGPPFQSGFDGNEVASYFLSCNRGKTIVNANIKDERERIRLLMDQADVVLENFKPGTFDRFLGPVRDDLIVCSISGYGQNGPRRNEVAFDLTMQARSGIMSITGDPEGAPAKVGVAWIDVMTGMNAVSAVLAALYQRERTGVGARIDISLWDTALAALVNQGHNALTGITPQRMGRAATEPVPYRVFEASDGWFAIGKERKTNGTRSSRHSSSMLRNTGTTTAPALLIETLWRPACRLPLQTETVKRLSAC